MSRVAVVYYSQTGNTEAMAQAVIEGAEAAGADVTAFTASEFTEDDAGQFDAIAFGCPASGSENLEESEFDPMFSSVEGALSGKKIALFGSYGWGGGEYMNDWEARCQEDGAVLAAEPVVCQDAPEDDTLEVLKTVGEALVS